VKTYPWSSILGFSPLQAFLSPSLLHLLKSLNNTQKKKIPQDPHMTLTDEEEEKMKFLFTFC
jgi:hypothetical protein